MIRNSDLAGCTYVEPYAGGAGAGVSLLVTGQVSRLVINDLDRAIYAFWATLVLDPDYYIRRINSIDINVAEWRRQRDIYHARSAIDTASLGFATFYLNRTNVSGVLNGGPIGGLEQGGNYKIDARFNREGLTERVRILALYAEDMTVTSRDGIETIEEYANRANTFVYADPPYFEKAGSLYLNKFTTEDHANLANVLNGLPDSPWLLTYDNVPQVADLYQSRRRRTFELSYSAHHVRRATEIAVLSDCIPDIGEGWPVSG